MQISYTRHFLHQKKKGVFSCAIKTQAIFLYNAQHRDDHPKRDTPRVVIAILSNVWLLKSLTNTRNSPSIAKNTRSGTAGRT